MVNETTNDVRGFFKDGVVFTEEDINNVFRYLELKDRSNTWHRTLNAVESAEMLMLDSKIRLLVEKDFFK